MDSLTKVWPECSDTLQGQLFCGFGMAVPSVRPLNYTIHVYSLLVLLLNCEESFPGPLDPLLRQDITARNIPALHQLRLEGPQFLAGFFSK